MHEAELTYDEIKVGQTAEFTVPITAELVADFARLSGDQNPLHMDEAYAAGTKFGERIAHGMLVGTLFSRLIGMHLPGKYALYLSQTLRFRAPIALGATLAIRGEVIHKTDVARTLTIKTTAHNDSSKELLVSGEALVQLLK